MGSIAGNRGLRFESVVFLELSHRQLVFVRSCDGFDLDSGLDANKQIARSWCM